MSWADQEVYLHNSFLTSSLMSEIQSTIFEIKRTVLLTDQSIDIGVTANDPVYAKVTTTTSTNSVSVSSHTWFTATENTTTPQGFFGINSEVALRGAVTDINSLSHGQYYWLNNGGGLTPYVSSSSTKTVIGYTKSSSEFIVNINIEASSYSVV